MASVMKELRMSNSTTYVLQRIFWSLKSSHFRKHWQGPSVVDKDKMYMKMERKFFGRKDEMFSNQRRIQNPVKHLRWKKLFVKIVNDYMFKVNNKGTRTTPMAFSILDVYLGSEYAWVLNMLRCLFLQKAPY